MLKVLLLLGLLLIACTKSDTSNDAGTPSSSRSGLFLKIEKPESDTIDNEIRLNYKFVLNFKAPQQFKFNKVSDAIFDTFSYKAETLELVFTVTEAVEGAGVTRIDFDKLFENYTRQFDKGIKVHRFDNNLGNYLIYKAERGMEFKISGQIRTKFHFIDFTINTNKLIGTELSQIYHLLDSIETYKKKAPKVLIKSLYELLKIHSDPNDKLLDAERESITELTLMGELHAEDLKFIGELKNLKYLNIENTQTSDLAFLPNLSHLEEICLIRNPIKDLYPLTKFSSLKAISLFETPIEDLTPIAKLPKIETLWLTYTKIKDLEPLSKLKNLKELRIGETQVKDLGPLKNCSSLEILILEGNKIDNYEVLANLINLQRLELESSNIKNLQFVSKLTKLKRLGLDQTEVTDISPLQELKGLKSLSIRKTNISGSQINQLQRVLPELHIFHQ